MTYFEFYDIPESFSIDANALKSKFFELSKKYHPDFFANESDEKQAEVLELSTLNTNAFNTLKDKTKRIEYVLGLYGLLENIEKTSLPQDFLLEMMGINERLMEMEFEENTDELEALQKEVENFEEELENEVREIFEHYSEYETDKKRLVLEKVKNYYLKKKYILRITETLNKFASRS